MASKNNVQVIEVFKTDSQLTTFLGTCMFSIEASSPLNEIMKTTKQMRLRRNDQKETNQIKVEDTG